MSQFSRLMRRLWADDAGSVAALKYLLMGSAVTVGGIAALNQFGIMVKKEFQHFAHSVHSINKPHSLSGQSADDADNGDAPPVESNVKTYQNPPTVNP